jgi:predicted phage gp36 major capsid-like protein
MSIEKIIATAIDNNPLKLKEAFDEEMSARIRTALEEKYRDRMDAKEEDDEDEDDEDESEDDDSDDSDDDEEVAKEMKAMHGKGASKAKVLKAVKEKYGCTGAKAEGLYASNCGG